MRVGRGCQAFNTHLKESVESLCAPELAIDQGHQGQGIGVLLLKAMFELTLEWRDRGGCVGVVVDAKLDAVPFYEQLDFTPLEVEQGTLSARPEPQPVRG